jgi:hypothetical protein
LRFRSAPGRPQEFKPAGTLEEPIQYCISDGGVGEEAVPGGYRQLSSYDDGRSPMPVTDDLKEVTAVQRFKGSQAEVIQDEEVRFFQVRKKLVPRSIPPAELQVHQKP